MTSPPVLHRLASMQAFRGIRAATKGGSLPPPLEPPASGLEPRKLSRLRQVSCVNLARATYWSIATSNWSAARRSWESGRAASFDNSANPGRKIRA